MHSLRLIGLVAYTRRSTRYDECMNVVTLHFLELSDWPYRLVASVELRLQVKLSMVLPENVPTTILLPSSKQKKKKEKLSFSRFQRGKDSKTRNYKWSTMNLLGAPKKHRPSNPVAVIAS